MHGTGLVVWFGWPRRASTLAVAPDRSDDDHAGYALVEFSLLFPNAATLKSRPLTLWRLAQYLPSYYDDNIFTKI